MPDIYLSFGSNVGDRGQNIARAVRLLHKSGVKITKMSSLLATAPVGGPPQATFLNAAAKGTTSLNPLKVLKKIRAIEETLGRVRQNKNGPRTIDIDILLYENLSMNKPQLTVPHPRMLCRSFVLKPLKEIAPETVKRLLCKS